MHFNESKNEVHEIIAWKYAYRQCRVNVCEQTARDRARFQRKIQGLADTLNEILTKEHRNKIYFERFVLYNK